MFRKIISFNEAKQIIKQNLIAKPIGVEIVPLSESYERVLAKDLKSPLNIPPFTRSTVDGYAVKACDTYNASEDNPVTLKFCGYVAIGEAPKVIVKNGLIAEIVTGAPIPDGADSVVMFEYTNHINNNVLVHRPVSIGENLMAQGSDIQKNETVLKAGRFLGPREIGLLAAIGLAKVLVYKRPKVAILSTGSEISTQGKKLPLGKIYDINGHTISAAVIEVGCEPINLGIIQDIKDELKKALLNALDSADVVITSGGVSVGPKDFIPKIVDSLGKPGILISGIAVKPGKPTTIALSKGKPIFSLPGNPTSSLFIFSQFVRPFLLKLAGRPLEELPKIKAIATKKIFSARGRRTFIMVNLDIDKSGRLFVTPVSSGLSGAITTLSKADGYIEISEKQQFVDSRSEIDVYLFDRLKRNRFLNTIE